VTAPIDRLNAALAGRYTIERELGAGGMATVYLARDLKHDREVAIKVLREDLSASIGKERFLREVKVAAALQHPHILPLFDSGAADALLFYVMPFVDGQSLRDRLEKEGELPIDDAVRITRDVADALGEAHRHGVVHRDVKPENVMLRGRHALVTDFGVAKAVSDATDGQSLTTVGVALGTPAYMAPEQATADPHVDHRADIYALGVIAYEMLTGQNPFAGTSAQRIVAAHLTRLPDAVSLHRSAVPPALEAIVMRCLEKSPADRFQGADEILRALDALPTTTTGAAMGGATPSRTNAAHPPRRRPWRTVTIGAVAALALIFAGVSWFARIGRAGTLIGDKVLAENDVVLVSEFENHTADSSLAGTVTDAIRMDLQQSRAVRVTSQSAMWAGLARMGLDHGTVLPQPKVQELAEREGAKAFVAGSIARVGSGFQITARVIATNGGAEALVARSTARDSTALIGAVEEVGRTLRRGIGESLRSVMTAPPLAQVTTASLPALRAYSASRRADLEGQRPRAVALSKEALAIDSTFASAWAGLYVTYTNMGLVRPATEAAQRAYALRGHLSEVERLRIEADYHGTRGEIVEEEAAWQRLAELGRDETNYANMLLGVGRLREAEDMGRRAVVSESKRSIAYWNLAEAQVGLHHFAAADSTADLIAKNLPENPYRYFIPASIRWGRRDLDAVESYLHSPDGAKLPGVAGQLCLVDLYRGRIRAWRQCPAQGPISNGNRLLVIAEFRMTGDTVRARNGYAPFLASAAEKRDPDEYSAVIALLADVGKVREARQLLDEWRARAGPSDLEFRADSADAIGSIAAAERQWDRAVAAFLAWNGSPPASAQHVYNRGLPEAAAILARTGKPDSAIVLFERALATSSLFGGNVYEARWYPQALSMLGDLYEARGDKARAEEYYRKYVDLLKGADPPLAAQAAAVRAKLAAYAPK
jgi:tetratricopeptide (TPR) repeat protein/TolB-like protein